MTTSSPAEITPKLALTANPPRWPIWTDSHGLMFAVAMGLWLPASTDGTGIFPSAETVGCLIGASRKSVEKYRTALVELRMLELVHQGKGRGDPSRYSLVEPGKWRTVQAEFAAAMAATSVAVKPMAEVSEAERVRAALRGAPNRKALVAIRHDWARVIEPDAALNGLYCTLATEFQRKENR